MNEQLASLIYYIKWLKSQGVDRAELCDQQDRIGFVVGLLADAPVTKLYQSRNWRGAGAPLPIVAIDIDANFNAAVDVVYAEQPENVQGGTDGNPSGRHAQGECCPRGRNYFTQYVQKECETCQERTALTSDVNAIWKNLGKYSSDNRVYGLAVGRVQSGKTRNYIGLLLKAIENGDYNTVVILTSKNRRLACQTDDRVRKWLRRVSVQNVTWLTNSNEENQTISWSGGYFNPDGVTVAVILKNETGHLGRFREWLGQLGDKHCRMRLLFIDDESDSATPNTNSVQESAINSKDDIQRLATSIDERDSDVKAWMKRLAELHFDDETIAKMAKELSSAGTRQEGFMKCVRSNLTIRSVLGTNVEVDHGGQRWMLYDRVYEVFNRGGQSASPNWRDLQDVLEYLFDIDPERSRINRSLCELVGVSGASRPVFEFEKMAYVAYTATPFANLLNENVEEDPLCPDFIKSLSVSPNYFGLDRIFGGKGNDCNLNVARLIPPDEYEAWVAPLQMRGLVEADCTPELVRRHNFAERNLPENVRCVEWKSLKRAIMWAFCTASARRWMRKQRIQGGQSSDDTKFRWTTMLFNISHLSDQARGVHVVQQNLVDQYVGSCLSCENREAFARDCMQVWAEETAEFSKGDFQRSVDDYGEIADYPSAADVEFELKDWFFIGGKVRVVQMNSRTEDRSSRDYYNKDCTDGDVLWIVCGGNAISRGLTLEGLTVSYYDRIRRGSAVDTITQMGRWFGYRKGYELLPRIWMTAETIGVMKEICRTENQLHEAINQLEEKQGEEDASGSIRRRLDDAMRIRFFGRRLTTRDANSEQIDGVAAFDVLNCVRNDPAEAIRATREFILQTLGLSRVWRRTVDDGFENDFHGRHRYYWKDVNAEVILRYVSVMRDVALCGASRDAAVGLMREIANVLTQKWNVVISNPLTNDASDVIEGINVNVRDRSGSTTAIQGGLRVGHATFAGQAFLAGVPSRFYHMGGGAHDDRREVESAYDELDQEYGRNHDQKLRPCLNPTLAIDFIKAAEARCYIILSFYWHGLKSGSYIQSILAPATPRYVEQVYNVLVQNNCNYVSRRTLRDLLGIGRNDSLSRRELDDQLQGVANMTNSPIGIVSANEAESAWISAGVVYLNVWMRQRQEMLRRENPAEIIALDLYERIRMHEWWENFPYMPDCELMERNYCNHIIKESTYGGDTNIFWTEFSRICEQLRKKIGGKL